MVRIVLGMLTVTLCASGMWTAHASRTLPRPLPIVTASERDFPASPGWTEPHVVPRREEAQQRLDRYGNDVSNAVATYTYDRAGIFYEEHSPQTEVPRLKPPTS